MLQYIKIRLKSSFEMWIKSYFKMRLKISIDLGREMSNIGHGKKYEETKSKVLRAAAKLFLQNGYQKSTAKEIAAEAEINYSTIFFVFKDKEAILCEILGHVLTLQSNKVGSLPSCKEVSPLERFAVEATLLLQLAERSEALREMYVVAYSLPHSPEILYRQLTGQLQAVFEKDLPDLEPKDFYEKEIAVGGILRSFICAPCDMYFSIKRKVRAMLDAIFSVYGASEERKRQATVFALSVDYEDIAGEIVGEVLQYIKKRT